MEALITLLFAGLFVGLFVLYIYAFVLLWKDKEFSDGFKLGGTIVFLVVGVAAYVYLLYRWLRNDE